METCLMILALVLLVLGGVAATVFFQVRMMSEPEKILRHNDQLLENILLRLSPKERDWIEQNGFDFLGAYRFAQISFAVWRHSGGMQELVVYASQKLAFDFVSHFEGDKGLTTSIGGEVGMFPILPGDYKESVPVQHLQELYEAHLESLRFLTERRGLRACQAPADFEAELCRGIHQQMDYVRSLSFYPLRGIYWFFIKRRQMAGKRIAEQIRRGWA